MPIDDNGVFIPQTIEEINTAIQTPLITAGVDLNVFDTSDYIQTTNPIVTRIYNLQVNVASFPDQIQKILNLENLQIKRAGIFTLDAILNLLLEDEDIEKADVRNFTPGEVTIYVFSSTADLINKDYTALTEAIVPITSVFGVYVDDGSAPSSSALRPNSLQSTTVYYNVATEVEIITSDANNLLTITYRGFVPLDEGIENDNINNRLIEIFANYKIGQSISTSLLSAEIFQVGEGRYSEVNVTFSGIDLTPSQLYKYSSSDISLIT